jgi:hypothetical protein
MICSLVESESCPELTGGTHVPGGCSLFSEKFTSGYAYRGDQKEKRFLKQR